LPEQTKNPFPVMERMTVRMVREYLARKKSIIVPIGSIEQHGYHLPLRTDAIIAERLAWQIGARTDMLVAPAVQTTFSGGGLPGTLNISPSVMSLVVSDLLLSLVSKGFRNIYLFLCHGGSENLRALTEALRMLLRSNPAFEHVLIALLPVWRFGRKDSGWMRAFREGDWHAGWLETSIMLAVAPGLVRLDEVELDTPELLQLQKEHPDNYQRAEKIVDDEFVVPRLTQRPDIKVGVMGDPERASRELGLEIVREIVEAAAAKIAGLEAKADGIYKEVPFIPEPIILTGD
jgi:creatinine amidohydrolase/Fe(II)-dependent formamide hydrolase-like protein